MSAELDALGGGDTRVAKVEGYCRVYPLLEDTPGTILSVDYDRSIVVVRYGILLSTFFSLLLFVKTIHTHT